MSTVTAAALVAATGGVMPRARNIKPAFFTNDELGDMPPLTRLLFAGLWCVADRAGRLEDRPKKIKMEVLPYDDCDVDAMLWELHAHKFIVRYVADGESLIEICKWAKHQRPHHTEKFSVLPAASAHVSTVKPTPDKANASLTVIGASCSRDNPPDTGYLIPDTGYLIPETKDQSHLSTSPKKTGELDGDVSKEVFEYWQRVMSKPRAKLDDKRRKLIRGALLKGYTATDMRLAIDGCAASPWHMGKNERGTPYNGIELIFRSAEKIDAFMQLADRPPALNATPTRDMERANIIAQLTGRNREQGARDDAYTIDG